MTHSREEGRKLRRDEEDEVNNWMNNSDCVYHSEINISGAADCREWIKFANDDASPDVSASRRLFLITVLWARCCRIQPPPKAHPPVVNPVRPAPRPKRVFIMVSSTRKSSLLSARLLSRKMLAVRRPVRQRVIPRFQTVKNSIDDSRKVR